MSEAVLILSSRENNASVGGAISVIPISISGSTSNCSNYIFSDAVVSDNQATFGGGIFLVVKKAVSLFGPTLSLERNIASRFGGAIFFDQYFNAVCEAISSERSDH